MLINFLIALTLINHMVMSKVKMLCLLNSINTFSAISGEVILEIQACLLKITIIKGMCFHAQIWL